jgi:tetratricopeptide (TPR) repeat protein
MGLLDRLRGGHPEVEGQIGYFGLSEWWLSAFTESEREYIQATFQPLGTEPGESLLTKGTIASSSSSAGSLLGSLAGWFKKRPEDLGLALRIVAKAEECARADEDILSLHFAYQGRIQLNYRWRDEIAGALDAALEACREQIAIAPRAAEAFRREYPDQPLPMHIGYEQLAIVLEKQGLFKEALPACREALERGWAGTWEKRIARIESRARKKGQ